MKKITDYRKLLGVTEQAGLDDLKNSYRTMIKFWHPDKYAQDVHARADAEEKSRSIIEAYHFLVSIALETRNQSIADYKETTNLSSIVDFHYKSQVLTVTFNDGNEYEYFDVPKSVYIKLVNADSPGRFARRHIYSSFLYRSRAKLVASA